MSLIADQEELITINVNFTIPTNKSGIAIKKLLANKFIKQIVTGSLYMLLSDLGLYYTAKRVPGDYITFVAKTTQNLKQYIKVFEKKFAQWQGDI